MSVRVRLCGALRVEVAGDDISGRLPARQGRLLFAYLVLAGGRAIRREELVDAIWPDRPPRDPAGALASVLARLRGVLGADALPARSTIRLDLGAESWVDVEAAAATPTQAGRALEEGQAELALNLAAEALAVIEEPLLAEFERDWIDARRRELADLAIPLIEVATEAGMRIGGGALTRAELLARRWVERHPLSESAHAALMRVVAARGDTAEALATYERLRVRLREELGATPSRPLLDLHQRLLTVAPVAPATGRERRTARIPLPPSPTLGRDDDLALVRRWFDDSGARLVTVVGPAGVGKTRLAVELAHAIEERFEDGAVFVSLAAVDDPSDVLPTLARELDIDLRAGESPQETLTRALRDQTRLLVLDNFEHLLDAAPDVAEILAGGRGLRVLTTSREPLHIRAERVYRLRPLPVDDEASPAVALFEFVARSHDPGFRLGPDDGASVLAMCRRLDGLPLAIELAAGSLGLASVPELAERLSERLGDALRPGPRDAPARQRTLMATLEWSHTLLTAPERSALAALSTFAGGCTVDAATIVTGASPSVLESLVEKNLVVLERSAGRLRLLETVRAFSAAQLAERADVETIRRRHCDHYLEMAQAAQRRIEQTGSRTDLTALEAEVGNLRAAVAWAIEQHAPDLALRLATALAASLGRWRLQHDTERWLSRALELEADDVPPAVRAAALEEYATLVVERRAFRVATNPGRVVAAAREGIALRRALSEPGGMAKGLCALARVKAWSECCDDAYALASEAERLAAEADDAATRTTARMIMALHAPTLQESLTLGDAVAAEYRAVGNLLELARLRSILCKAALENGEPQAAARLADDAFSIAESIREPGLLAYVLGDVGFAALFAGDFERAHDSFARQLELARRHQDLRLVNEALIGLAGVAAREGQNELAARLHGAAHATTPERVRPGIARRLDRWFAVARARIGEQAWQTFSAAGASDDLAALAGRRNLTRT